MQSLTYAFHHTLTEIRREGTGGGWVGGILTCTFVCGNGATGTQVSMLHCWLWQAKLCQRNATSKTLQAKEQNCDILDGRNPHETQFSIKRQSKKQVFWDYKNTEFIGKNNVFSTPHCKYVKKQLMCIIKMRTKPQRHWFFVKTTKHIIAMPARTVSGPAGGFWRSFTSIDLLAFIQLTLLLCLYFQTFWTNQRQIWGLFACQDGFIFSFSFLVSSWCSTTSRCEGPGGLRLQLAHHAGNDLSELGQDDSVKTPAV